MSFGPIPASMTEVRIWNGGIQQAAKDPFGFAQIVGRERNGIDAVFVAGIFAEGLRKTSIGSEDSTKNNKRDCQNPQNRLASGPHDTPSARGKASTRE